jgi:hypothetical protein
MTPEQTWNERWTEAGADIEGGFRAPTESSVEWWMRATKGGSEHTAEGKRSIYGPMSFDSVVASVKHEISNVVRPWLGSMLPPDKR